MKEILPFDCQIQILPRVTVKDMIRFKLVSRMWMNLIESSSYISEHTLRQMETNHHLLLIFNDPVTERRKYSSFVDDDLFPNNRVIHEADFPVENLRAVISDPELLQIIGNCVGLVGLHTRGKDTVILSNLAIKRATLVRVPVVEDEDVNAITLGFGICYSNGSSFEPVILKMTSSEDVGWKAEACHLSSRVWKRLDNNLSDKAIDISSQQVAMGECLYWIASAPRAPTRFILSFHLPSASFIKMELPEAVATIDSAVPVHISQSRVSLVVMDYRWPNTEGKYNRQKVLFL